MFIGFSLCHRNLPRILWTTPMDSFEVYLHWPASTCFLFIYLIQRTMLQFLFLSGPHNQFDKMKTKQAFTNSKPTTSRNIHVLVILLDKFSASRFFFFPSFGGGVSYTSLQRGKKTQQQPTKKRGQTIQGLDISAYGNTRKGEACNTKNEVEILSTNKMQKGLLEIELIKL